MALEKGRTRYRSPCTLKRQTRAASRQPTAKHCISHGAKAAIKAATRDSGEGIQVQHARPNRSENRATLAASIAPGASWLDELTRDATAAANRIARRVWRRECRARPARTTPPLAA